MLVVLEVLVVLSSIIMLVVLSSDNSVNSAE